MAVHAEPERFQGDLGRQRQAAQHRRPSYSGCPGAAAEQARALAGQHHGAGHRQALGSQPGQQRQNGSREDDVAAVAAAQLEERDSEHQSNGESLETAECPRGEWRRSCGEQCGDGGGRLSDDVPAPDVDEDHAGEPAEHAKGARRSQCRPSGEVGPGLDGHEQRIAVPLRPRAAGIPHEPVPGGEVFGVAHGDPGVVGDEGPVLPAQPQVDDGGQPDYGDAQPCRPAGSIRRRTRGSLAVAGDNGHAGSRPP